MTDIAPANDGSADSQHRRGAGDERNSPELISIIAWSVGLSR
jgi:hypothetical protein